MKFEKEDTKRHINLCYSVYGLIRKQAFFSCDRLPGVTARLLYRNVGAVERPQTSLKVYARQARPLGKPISYVLSTNMQCLCDSVKKAKRSKYGIAHAGKDAE